MKDATQLTSGSLPLFVAEQLLSRCDVLWESTLVFLEESFQFYPGSPSIIMTRGPFSCYCLGLLSNCNRELGVLLELQQVTQVSFRVVVKPLLELQWSQSSQVALCRLVPVYPHCVGGCSLVVAWGFNLVAVGIHSLFVVGWLLSDCYLHTPL